MAIRKKERKKRKKKEKERVNPLIFLSIRVLRSGQLRLDLGLVSS